MRKDNRRRAFLVAGSIAIVLILTQSVRSLADLVSTNSDLGIIVLRNDSDISSVIVNTEDGVLQNQRFSLTRNGQIVTTDDLNDLIGSDEPRYLITAFNLRELNLLKTNLTEQLETITSQDPVDEEEKSRIVNQLDIVNDAIDATTDQLQSTQPSQSAVEEEPTSSGDTSIDADNLFIPRENNIQSESSEPEIDRNAMIPRVRNSEVRDEAWKTHLFNVLKWSCYFVATVAGILFKSLWDSSSLKALFKFSNVKPILIAPIVFYGVYATVNTLSDNLLAVLIAFQNGFFWQSILRNEENKFKNQSVERDSTEGVQTM